MIRSIHLTTLMLLLPVAGCAGRRDSHDPLMGIHPNPVSPTGVPVNTPPKKTASLSPIDVPTPTSNTTAALAGLNGGRPLFIGNPNQAPVNTPATNGPPAIPGNPNTPPKVVPLPKATQPPSIMTVGSVSAQKQIEESLRGQLRAAGVVYHKVDNVPEGLRLTVMVPEAGTENTRLLEATAPDFSGAVSAILQKIRR